MCKKLNYLISFVLVLSLAGVAQVSAGTFRNWTDATGDHNWFTAENWSPNGVPQSNDDGDGTSIAQNSPGATIAGPGAVTWDLYVGGLDVPLTPGTLTIDGGTLSCGRSSSTGFHGNGTVNMLSGTWNSAGWMHWGRGGHATFNMSGGSVTVGNEFSVGAGHGENGQAIVNLSGGGVITAGSLFVINNPAESWIDITEGTLIINGDVTTLINGYLGNGRIKTGGDVVSLDYNITNAGKTTLFVTSYIQPISPTKGEWVTTGLSELCWTSPDPNAPGDIITYDVYLGTSEPNSTLPGYGLPMIAEGITDTCASIPTPVEEFETYYWVVDFYDSRGKVEGQPWSFYVYNNEAPVVDAGPEVEYVWFGNAGNPAAASVVLDGTASDDGQPTTPLILLWEQVSGPAEIIGPDGILAEDVNLEISVLGTYEFRLTADDTDLTASDTIQIVVAATACDAAKAVPGYEPIATDFTDDCIVDLKDLAALAAQFLECNSLQCP